MLEMLRQDAGCQIDIVRSMTMLQHEARIGAGWEVKAYG